MAVVIETTLGDITVDLFLDQRPVTCLNFLKLCKMKYYNFSLFHTIRSGFIAQTGDPSGEGSGGESIFGLLEGPSKRFFSGEKMPKIRHTEVGLLSMVCTDDMMVGSQFFFTLGPDLDSLDGVHCVIGEVTEGHEVLRKLNEVICDEFHRPYQDVRITHTVVLEDPFNDPPGLRAPSRSPSPNPERLKGGRLAPDEDLDETQGKTAEEIQEIIEAKEAKARATILEIIGDLPDADIAPPENVLFVCKLNPVTTDEDLEIIFSRFGKIESCEVIRDKKTGDSLQYAFIEFADKKSCEDAYFKMDNVLIDDRRIHVDFSQSVSKIKWLGKGRGVKHINENEPKENQIRPDKIENKSKDRENKSHNHRESDRHEKYRDNKNREDYKERNRDKRNREKNDPKYRTDRERSRSRPKYDDSKDNNSKKYTNTRENNDYKKDKHRNKSKSREIIKSKKETNKHRNSRKVDSVESNSNSKHCHRENKTYTHKSETREVPKEPREDSQSSRNNDYRKQGMRESHSNYVPGEHVRNYENKLKPSENREKSKSPSMHKSHNNNKEFTMEHSHKRINYSKENKNNEKVVEYKKKESNELAEDRKKIEKTKRRQKRKDDGKEYSLPVKDKKKKIDLKNNKKLKVVNKKKGLKKKRKPSTSSSSSSGSDSSDSSSSTSDTSDSSSSSDSDNKKKKSKARKRKHSETSSSSSSSSSTSSSSDSSSDTSSSSSDSEPRKKKSKTKLKLKNDKKHRKKYC